MNSQLEQDRALEMVRNAIKNHKQDIFEVEELPNRFTESTIKGILDAIFKIVKNAKSFPEQKIIALKILKKTILHTKNSQFINAFLTCYLWKFFTNQYRQYLRNNKVSPSIMYTQNYFKLLEDMLENFNVDLGKDANNKETPFSKYWKAVHKEPNQKNLYASKLLLKIALLKPKNEKSWSSLKNLLMNYENDRECKPFIKQKLKSFQEKNKYIKQLYVKNKLNQEQCFLLKRDYYKSCEKDYFYGYVDDEAYDMFSEVVLLEIEKDKIINHQQEFIKEELKLRNSKEQEKKIKNENNKNEVSFQDSYSVIRREQKKTSSFKAQNNDFRSNNLKSNQESKNNILQDLVQPSKNFQNSNQNFSSILSSKNISARKNENLNLMKEVSQIGKKSHQYNSDDSKSYHNVLNMLSDTVMIDQKRIDIQKNISIQEIQKMKAFAFLQKIKLDQNENIKIGLQAKFIQNQQYNYIKKIEISCFIDQIYGNPKHFILNLKHSSKNFPVEKTMNSLIFNLYSFDQNVDYPSLNITYYINEERINLSYFIYIPINKFLKIPKQTQQEQQKYLEPGFKSLCSDPFPLDMNFFKSVKEIKFAFKNFLIIDQSFVQGIFELQCSNDKFLMKIQTLENYQFSIEIRYFQANMKTHLKKLLIEVIFLLSDFAHQNDNNQLQCLRIIQIFFLILKNQIFNKKFLIQISTLIEKTHNLLIKTMYYQKFVLDLKNISKKINKNLLNF